MRLGAKPRAWFEGRAPSLDASHVRLLVSKIRCVAEKSSTRLFQNVMLECLK